MIGRLAFRRKSTIALLCEPSVAYEVLSDYGTYVEWMPAVRTSHVMSRETNFAIADVEFATTPAQKITLECLHAPTQMVIARSLSGHATTLRMEWRITAAGPGECRVSLALTGPVYFLRVSPSRLLRALKAQVATFASNVPAGEVLIEITEGEQGLMCTYRGKKYKMEAVA